MKEITARVCRICGKPKGCASFRFFLDGRWQMGYFHLECFRKFTGRLFHRNWEDPEYSIEVEARGINLDIKV